MDETEYIAGLVRQRFRWKWGRSQTFLKNLNMFFNSDKRFTKGFTFIYLPFAIFSDIAFLFEPLFILYIFYIIFRFGDLITLISAFLIISSYIILTIIMEETISTKDKMVYVTVAPFMYLFFYVLSLVEYIALIKTLVNLPRLKQSIYENICRWDHVDRLGLKQRFG